MEPALALTPQPHPLTAVVVDDSMTCRAVLKMHLARHGFQVVAEAGTGAEALPLYERYRPTLLTLDIVLPVQDGVSAAIELLARHPGATVVMCSSITARDKILACRSAGVANFVLKPFTPEKLASVFGAVASRAQGNPGQGGAL